ncbi:hypothetical protein KPL71_023160 [Citrus sinensis]|uniref:Uncharacterized protein n=1 Tax=Citrus sinensis TaxID=2711 RepID=A0ACB8IHM7_CITSI|nr:hypothetical protein KPL71_023160 [Citrus sinensis]
MATLFSGLAPITTPLKHRCSVLQKRWHIGVFRMTMLTPFSSTNSIEWKRRRNLICAVSRGPEEAFKKTVEVDRLIDMLRDANPKELQQLVVENILAFNEGFWIRLAARTDTCKSEDDKAWFLTWLILIFYCVPVVDFLQFPLYNNGFGIISVLLQKDYEELATSVMNIVDRIVHKTHEKIESATDVLKAILKPVVHEEEEISWPPRDPEALKLMEKEIVQREQEGQLDEGFLAEVNAQLRQSKEDGDKPGLEAMLQKVLQLYASIKLSKKSYAKKGNEVLKAEQFLETIIKGAYLLPCFYAFRKTATPEEEWNKLLIDGLTVGKGEISPEEFYAVIKKRIERILIRTEGGSYQQRILTEYVKGIQSRTEQLVQLLQGNPQ